MEIDEKYPLALRPKTILAGCYIIEQVLGQGGFGITYRAVDHKTKKMVAIKEYFPDSLAYRDGLKVISFTGDRRENYEYGKKNFLQEAKTLAEFIGDPNIVRVHSYFEENNTAYFVMDYVEGKCLSDYVKQKNGKISFEETEDILFPIMDALASVHSKGIIHRDVTPDNIFIRNDGRSILIDFGAARYSLGDKSKSLDVILKHGFAPMEQYTRRGRQGAFTDIYSLAATFYYCIVGTRPPDSIERIVNDELVLPSSAGLDIPKGSEAVILKAMSVRSFERYQTMDEFKNELEKYSRRKALPVPEKKPLVEKKPPKVQSPQVRQQSQVTNQPVKQPSPFPVQPVRQQATVIQKPVRDLSPEPAIPGTAVPQNTIKQNTSNNSKEAVSEIKKTLKPDIPDKDTLHSEEVQVQSSGILTEPREISEPVFNDGKKAVSDDHKAFKAEKYSVKAQPPEKQPPQLNTSKNTKRLIGIIVAASTTIVIITAALLIANTRNDYAISTKADDFSSEESDYSVTVPAGISHTPSLPLESPAYSKPDSSVQSVEASESSPESSISSSKAPVEKSKKPEESSKRVKETSKGKSESSREASEVSKNESSEDSPVSSEPVSSEVISSEIESSDEPDSNYSLDGNTLTISSDSYFVSDYKQFQYSDNIRKIVIENGVTKIRSKSFISCSSLTEVSIPDSVTSIGSYAFNNCTSLSDIIIPGGVSSIGNWAFADCSGMSEVIISDNLQSIGSAAFNNCYSVKRITIPGSVTSIGKSAFTGWSPDQTIIVNGRTEAPGGWDDNWDKYCDAIIQWNA